MKHDSTIVARILKILAKTERANCTPAEAATAQTLAANMMQQHGLRFADLKQAHATITGSRPETSAPAWANSQFELLLWYRQQYPGCNLGSLPGGMRQITIRPRTHRVGTLAMEYNDLVGFLTMLPNCPDGSWGFIRNSVEFFIVPMLPSAQPRASSTRDELAAIDREWSVEIPVGRRKSKLLADTLHLVFGDRFRFL